MLAEKCKLYENFWAAYDMSTEKHVLVQKIFTNGLNMCMPLWIKDTVYEVGTHWLSSRKKVPGTAVSKEGHIDSVAERKNF